MDSLDSDTLFDLALQASQTKDTQKSIGLLKTALAQSPDDARMWYMLGTLYTDIGLYDKAVQHMETCLEVDPDYAMARFHLGLLQLMAGHTERAQATWQALDALGDTHYLWLFKSGLLKMVDHDIDAGVALIREGIQRNHLVDSLNKDMEMVVENALLSGRQGPG